MKTSWNHGAMSRDAIGSKKLRSTGIKIPKSAMIKLLQRTFLRPIEYEKYGKIRETLGKLGEKKMTG